MEIYLLGRGEKKTAPPLNPLGQTYSLSSSAVPLGLRYTGSHNGPAHYAILGFEIQQINYLMAVDQIRHREFVEIPLVGDKCRQLCAPNRNDFRF